MILLLGGSGKIGRRLQQLLPGGLVAPSRAELDICDRGALANLLGSQKFNAVINAAAYTDVARAERDEARCFAVNASGVAQVAELTAALGIRLVHFSTDYVFDGASPRPYREHDRAAPLNAYGRSKARAEQLLQGHPDCLIIRTSWLFDRQGPSFFSKIEQGLKTSGAVSVVNDQWGAPTWARDLAHASLILLRSGQRGLIHFSSLGEATWYELACYYVRLRGLEGIVTPTATGPSDVPRPRYSVLDQKLATSLGALTHLQRSWQQTLAACFAPDLALPGAEVDPLDGTSPKPMQGFAHHSARVADPG